LLIYWLKENLSWELISIPKEGKIAYLPKTVGIKLSPTEDKYTPNWWLVNSLRRVFLFKEMLKAQKQTVVEVITDELKKATTVVMVDFTGLSMGTQQELKKRLKEVGAKMMVAKNTLIKRAGSEAKIDDQTLTDAVLSGQTALILSSNDPIASIQVLGKFAKEFELPHFKVGIVEGVFYDKDNLVKLSKLPAKEVLLTQVLGSIASPMYGLVSTLNANMQKLVFILDQKAKGVTN
jgi:large subunit ribosomal protein L10